MTADHSARLRSLTSDRRDAVLERAAILIFDAGLDPDAADERAWNEESGRVPQLKLGGVR